MPKAGAHRENVPLDEQLREACRHARVIVPLGGLPRITLQDIANYLRSHFVERTPTSVVREHLRKAHKLKAVRKDWASRERHQRTYFLMDEDYFTFVNGDKNDQRPS